MCRSLQTNLIDYRYYFVREALDVEIGSCSAMCGVRFRCGVLIDAAIDIGRGRSSRLRADSWFRAGIAGEDEGAD
jgi:hypothetical protein